MSTPVVPKTINAIETGLSERRAYTFDQMSDTGLLWFINSALLNPMGLALALDYAEGEDEPRGWSIIGADGPIVINVDEQERKTKVLTISTIFQHAKEVGRVPVNLDGNCPDSVDVF
jgi:hypothetical protein